MMVSGLMQEQKIVHAEKAFFVPLVSSTAISTLFTVSPFSAPV
jgi:hypothetical protein